MKVSQQSNLAQEPAFRGTIRPARAPAATIATGCLVMLLAAGILSAAGTLNVADEKPEREAIAKRYAGPAGRIIRGTLADNNAWEKLEYLCDDIGHRLSGSPQLEQAVDWAVATLKKDGQENVRAEPVMVPKWVRGRESLVMVEPRRHEIPMLGLGGSVGTPGEGVTGPVIVVCDEKEFEALGERAKGKIILFNNPMPAYNPVEGTRYGSTVRFRSTGANLAAGKGAIACLVRSVTARSLRSPHTGAMRTYNEEVPKIPAAAICTEDAEMLARLCARGVEPVLTLKMEARDEGMVPSANVVAELRGREKPEEIVVIGGHLDSWDVGQGAHDDGSGCVIAMEAINVLRKWNMIPRRTIRVVLWTNEENGLRGGRQYAIDHKDEMGKHVAAIEADSGAFQPTGFSIECSDAERQKMAAAQLEDLLQLLKPLGATRVEVGHSGADISPMREHGVVLMGQSFDDSIYFDYHHSHADTLDKVDRQDLSKCVAAMTVVAYVLADMPERIGEPKK